jgi:hypothetical protein
MFKMFSKKGTKKETYKVVFCDTSDLATKFGEYGTYETYETADHVIRMAWNKKKEDKINNGYKINDAWVLIEKS